MIITNKKERKIKKLDKEIKKSEGIRKMNIEIYKKKEIPKRISYFTYCFAPS